jgi:hypothetical protein
LRGKPAATVAARGLFALYEREIQEGLPGIRIKVNGPEREDEIGLAVERLREAARCCQRGTSTLGTDDAGTNGRAAVSEAAESAIDSSRHALFMREAA